MRVQGSALGRDRLAGFCVNAAAAIIVSSLIFPATALALTCSSTNVPDCRPCKTPVCLVDGDTARWMCQADSTKNGISCTDNNACTTGDVCSNGGCVGTPVTCNPIDACHTAGTCSPSTGVCSAGAVTCVPGGPGPITGPSTSTSGSYVLSWGASSGVVDNYVFYENGVGIYNTTGLSASLAGRGDGSYTYKVQACNSAGCGAFTATFVVSVLLTPGAPGALSVPAESGPNYTVSWQPGSGRSDRYELGESQDSGSTWTTSSVVTTSVSFTNKAYGPYSYRVRACNPSGCSAYASAQNYSVLVLAWLSTLPDAAVVAPGMPIPSPAAVVGTIPGTASTEGGAATYRIPIEVPPGRAGMQPDIALTYSSRSGNGVAGLGWSLSVTRSIYRCPRTLTQDGANRSVQHDDSDQLCFDGQRLIAAPGSVPGTAVTEYRTEVDRFDRITLNGVRSSWGSYFLVEHKSGRVSRFEPLVGPAGVGAPDVWYLTRESDRQGNCVGYNYTVFSRKGSGLDAEDVLTSISYTGTSTSISASTCPVTADARGVEFEYTADREDIRTTYRFGVASPMTARLAAIKTRVGTQYVRRYELSYKMSNATRRSLLQTVTLCAGGTCGGEKLPATSFTYQEEQQSFTKWHVQFKKDAQSALETLGPEWRANSAGDFDGDGRRDHVYDRIAPDGSRTRYLDATSCPLPVAFDASAWLNFDFLRGLLSLETSEDIDHDGKADVLGTPNGRVAFANVTCSGLSPTETDLGIVFGANSVVGLTDYDGDGIADLSYYRYVPPGPPDERIFRRRTESLTGWSNSDTILPPPKPDPSMVVQAARDINGDGLTDTIFDSATAAQQPTYITFFKGVGQGFTNPILLSSLGGPGQAFADQPQRRWIDVNGDGLVDIYEPGSIWLNQGGAPGSSVTFRRVNVTMPPDPADPANNPDRARYAFTMDYDADGAQELMVPNARTVAWCGGDGTPIGQADVAWFCGSEFDSAPPAWKARDQSVFQWNAYKFIEKADGNYAMVMVPTNLEAPINTAIGINPVDWNGDGMTDVRFHLVNSSEDPNRPFFDHYQMPATDAGPYVSLGLARAPDLLVGVTNGIGATASWAHQPLSRAETASVGCDMPTGESFYVAHNADPSRGFGYVFFTSSMWIVSRFDASNGIGSGMNKTCYRYQDGMLDDRGRGFQGFKVIVAEEQLPPAAGEDVDPTLTGCGDKCSVNNLRTTTEFHQEFPLTSRMKRVSVALARPKGTSLSETTYWWHAEKTAFGAWVVYSPAALEKKFDLPETVGGAARLARQTETVSQVQLVSGETTQTCTLVNGQTPVAGPPISPQDVIQGEARTIENDTSAGIWWIGRVTSRELLTDFLTGSFTPLDEQCLISGTLPQKCATPPRIPPTTPPACPAITQSADAKIQTVNYVWNPDNAAVGARRKLQSETLLLRTVIETQTSYDYDASTGGFGNVTGKHVTGRDIAGELLTTYAYSGDGYFRRTETKRPTASVQHVSTLTIDPATGLPTYQQDIQGGPATTTVYDSLGRVRTVTLDGTQPMEHRLSCRTPVPNCVPKRQVFQAGAPIKTEYMDLLGRAVATGVEGFEGTEIVTKVSYNARGLKVAEFAPWKSPGQAGQWDGTSASTFVTQYSSIDALARVRTKTVVRAATGLFEAGRGEATLTTTYSYVPVEIGLRTDIAVSKPASQGGALTMSRTYDRRGKLVATTQSTTPTHSIPANYFYDPAGNLLTILDAGGNKLVASYDDLGRKKRVEDPDRGIWTYAWDGIGRLESQTDARGNVVSHQYDGVGRLLQRTAPDLAHPGQVMVDTWQYDPNGKVGVLGALVGGDGFRRDYVYDPLLRPFSVKTTVPAGADWAGQVFIEEYGYDRNYGRVKAMSYPSGEAVMLKYDSRGNPLTETQVATDGTLGTVYRTVQGMSVRGQVSGQTLGNGIFEEMTYDDSTGLMLQVHSDGLREPVPTGCAAATNVRQTYYTYDHFLNVAKQQKNFYLRDASGTLRFSPCPTSAAATEMYQYDPLQRLLGSSRSWTGLTPGPGTTLGDTYAYNDLGNIVRKSDYADLYTYGTSRVTGSAGPHAVVSASSGGVTRATFTYDANGNLVQGEGRTVAFDGLDRPITVTMGGVTTQFRYAPDGARYLQRTTGIPSSPSAKTVYYVDKDYERIDWPLDFEEKTYIGPSVAVYNRNRTNRDVRYLHLDHLGSTDSVTNAGAFELAADAHGFDAFGKPRGRDWQPSGDRLHTDTDFQKTTEHGFTKHEHLDDTYLIHMNGRVYDYRLGRFLSVDPIISNPANSQSINPYSYIGNNPLSGTDPTGYEECGTSGPCNTTGVQQRIETTGSHILGTPGQLSAPVSNVTVNGTPITPGLIAAANAAYNAQSGAQSQTAQQAGSNAVNQGAPGQNANQNDQPSRTADQGVPVPNKLVPLTPETNRLAISLESQLPVNQDGTESALTSTAKGETALAKECTTTSCEVPVIDKAVLAAHRHTRFVADSNDPETRSAIREANRMREMPGPEDWMMIQRKSIPSYIFTPTNRAVGFEFNEYNGLRGYYYSYLRKDGTTDSGPFLWDRKQVQP